MAGQSASEKILGLRDDAAGLLDLMHQDRDEALRDRSLEMQFNVKQAAELVGRAETSIRRAEDEGALPAAPRRESGHRVGYRLADLNAMRAHFGTAPRRQPGDELAVMAVQNFKGGVGKSTLSVHCAQYFALRGYRVLLVDADPQATSTTLFGVHPERDVDPDTQTLLATFRGEAFDLAGLRRGTHWDGLDLLPSCLGLYNAEYELAARGEASRFTLLSRALESVEGDYDIVVIDPPPALGMISLSVMQAANGLLVPVPPSSIDYASTVSFLTMLANTLAILEERGLDADYAFVRLVATKINEAKGAHIELREAMKEVFGGAILPTALLDSAEFDTAGVSLRTVYEHGGRPTQTYRRCRKNLDMVLGDVLAAIEATWPSAQERRRAEGAA